MYFYLGYSGSCSLLLCGCFHTCARRCVPSHVLCHVCFHICAFMCSHLPALLCLPYMCARICVLSFGVCSLVRALLNFIVFLFGVCCRDNSFTFPPRPRDPTQHCAASLALNISIAIFLGAYCGYSWEKANAYQRLITSAAYPYGLLAQWRLQNTQTSNKLQKKQLFLYQLHGRLEV